MNPQFIAGPPNMGAPSPGQLPFMPPPLNGAAHPPAGAGNLSVILTDKIQAMNLNLKQNGPFPNGQFQQQHFPPGQQQFNQMPSQFQPGQMPPGQIPPGQIPPGKIPPQMGQMPPGHMPLGQTPPGQMPPGQMGPGHMPPGHAPPGQMTPGQMPLGQMAPGQMPPGQMPPGQMPPSQMQSGQMPPSQMPPGQMQSGQMPPSQMPPGQMQSGQMPPGQSMPGQQPLIGQVPPGPMPPGPIPPGQIPTGRQIPPRSMPPAQHSSGQFSPRQGMPQNGSAVHSELHSQFPPTSNAAIQRPPSNLGAQILPPASAPSILDSRPPPAAMPQPSMPPSQSNLPPSSTPTSFPPAPQAATNPLPRQPQTSAMPPNRGNFAQMPPVSQGLPSANFGGQNVPSFPAQSVPQSFPGQPPLNQAPGFTNPMMPSNAGMPPQPTMPPMGSAPHPGMPPLPGQQYQKPLPKGQMLGSISGVSPLVREPNFPPTGQPGFPPQQPGFPPQQSGFPLQQQPRLPPQPGFQQQQPGYPAQQPGYPPQQTGFPPQQPGFPPQQSGYPPQQQPGFPPQQQPGYPGQQGAYGAQKQPFEYQQQAPAKRLNPDQMPSPIQVMSDDQSNNGGVFVTNQKGLVPPLVTTDFTVDDKGNSSPRYIRSSMYCVPATADMIKQTAIPFCVVISPMAETKGAEQPPPLLDYSVLTGSPGMGPVRCSRCKAYMCPAMRFLDAGRHFQCAFCKASTEVPMEYTQYLNQSQHYGQATPEMSLGCYEIVATKEYCRNNVLPAKPALIFVVDVSYNAVRSGMVALVVGQLKTLMAGLVDPPRVGLITYSSTVHFYNINETLAQPQMLVVGDVNEVFVPLARGLLVEPSQAEHLLEALAQQVPLMFQENKETETILLPAVQAGLEALKAANCCGKLLVFHSSLPTANAPGRLTNRDDRKLLGTDKEKNILTPQTKAYNEVAQDCVGAGCGVELFLFNSSYVDAATLGQLPRLTGGSLHKYTYFQADTDGERFIADLTRVLSRPTAYDAIMRVRTSTGVRATDFFGHFFMSNTTDVELACLDSDKALGIEIKHDDKLTDEDGVYIQVALLYTHASGQRRLRICNLSLGVATQMADLYRCCDLDTTINFLAKQAVWRLTDHSPKSIKEGIVARCAQALVCYRKHCASPTSAGQLVLPESMKLLPLYANCLIRSDALSGGTDMTCDDRSWAMMSMLSCDVAGSLAALYPRLLVLTPLAQGNPACPMRCTQDKLREDSLYLLENGVHMMLWIGLQMPTELVQELFGVKTAAEINVDTLHIPELNTPFNQAVRQLIDSVRSERRRHMRLTLVRQHDKLEAVFRHFLVEDQGHDGSASYVDFLCHVHQEIRALL